MSLNEQPNEKDWIDRIIGLSSPWFFSITLHAAILIVLTFFLLQLTTQESAHLVVKPTYDILVDEEPIYDVRLGDPDEEFTPIAGHSDQKEEEEEFVFVQTDEPDVEQPPGNLPNSQSNEISAWGEAAASNGTPDLPFAISPFENREPGNRQSALHAGGGTALTEDVVVRGLHWLSKNQNEKGFWSLKGPYPDGTRGEENRPAATALALLAFQGQGNTTERGEYTETVKKAWGWLILQQDEEGCFFREGHREQRFYTQGLCTIVLCELYGMTRNPELKEKLRKSAQLAVDYCLQHQTQSGGWKYYTTSESEVWKGYTRNTSDLSVTGWIVMGLKSAEKSGLDVPQGAYDRISRFLDSVAVEGGSRYLYEVGHPAVTRSMTAEGLLCRLYLGWKRDDSRVRDGAKWLTLPENLVLFTGKTPTGHINERDVYYWYYATQFLHHVRGTFWDKWNKAMMQAICENQIKTGPESGSWDPNRPSQDRYAEWGRLYVTTLSICTLEVYYRYLPLYRGL